MRRLFPKLLFPLSLLIAVGIVGFVIWRAGNTEVADVERLGFQDSDVPLRMPVTGDVDERFHFLSAYQVAQVPRALRFDPPLGSDHGGLVYNAQKFGELNEARGGPHLGDDLNGIGGMNSDLGDPVYAPADGLVVYAGEPSPGWGNVVVLAHKAPDGSPLASMLAHLDRIEVLSGALVARGARVGSVGTANGNYPAHLHFEMRASDGVDIGGGYSAEPMNRLDPSATVAALRNAAADDRAPSALALLLVPDDDPWSAIETNDPKAVDRLLEIINQGKK